MSCYAHAPNRDTIVLHGEDGRIFAVLGGQPRGGDWSRVVASMAEAIEAKRSQLSIALADLIHRRGAFAAVLKGIIHGNGTTVSSVLVNAYQMLISRSTRSTQASRLTQR